MESKSLPERRNTPAALAWQAAGAFLWGVFFSISPFLEVLVLAFPCWFVLLLIRERRRARRYGLFPGLLLRAGVAALVIAVATLLPLKYEDERTIGPLAHNPATSAELADALGDQGVNLDPRTLPSDAVFAFTSTTPTLREVIGRVEADTPLRCRKAACGNGVTILWGSAPIYLAFQ